MTQSEYNRAYYQAHREKMLEYAKTYRRKHKADLNEYSQLYYKANRETLLLQQRQNRKQMKLDVLSHYSATNSPSCARCGIDDADVLCIDHIENNGYQHRRQDNYRWDFYTWLVKNDYPKGYQTLCFNCNMKKRMEIIREKETELLPTELLGG